MATVAEIYARLNAEGGQPPWVSTIRRTTLKEYEVANQHSLAPIRKVTVGALSGALTVLAVYLLGLAGVELPAEASSAVTVLVSTVLAYIVPSADQDVE